MTRLAELPAMRMELAPLAAALEALGRPQDRLPPVVHVTGTNGKGSTLLALQALIGPAHRFMSPAVLPDGSDGLQVPGLPAGTPLPDLPPGLPPLTAFEQAVAGMLLAFARHPAPLALIEVGMGGARDATNLVSTTCLCLVTPVGMDHAAWLGDSPAAIAKEKAGIFRPGVPVLSALQMPEVEAVLRAAAARLQAPLRIVPPWPENRPLPEGIHGRHQRQNLALAEAAAALLLGRAPDLTRLEGLVLPGRLQALAPGLWLDGAHNGPGLAALAESLGDLPGSGAFDLVLGLMADRDPALFAPLLAAAGDGRVWTVPVEAGPRSRPAEALAEALPGAMPLASVAAALAEQRATHRMLITGSLTLVAPALEASAKAC